MSDVRDLQTIRSTSLDLRRLNVLIGANGSGKSSFVSFFRTLSSTVNGRLQRTVAPGKLWELVRLTGQDGRDELLPNEIADFNGATFRAVPPPEWAKKW